MISGIDNYLMILTHLVVLVLGIFLGRILNKDKKDE